MFKKRNKKIQILQEELYITRLENASLRARLEKALAKKEPAKKTVAKKTTTKKAAK
jgi:regulator of replication initiation timing